jgi:hypothetical protein
MLQEMNISAMNNVKGGSACGAMTIYGAAAAREAGTAVREARAGNLGGAANAAARSAEHAISAGQQVGQCAQEVKNTTNSIEQSARTFSRGICEMATQGTGIKCK